MREETGTHTSVYRIRRAYLSPIESAPVFTWTKPRNYGARISLSVGTFAGWFEPIALHCVGCFVPACVLDAIIGEHADIDF